jgi:hypothetical protein
LIVRDVELSKTTAGRFQDEAAFTLNIEELDIIDVEELEGEVMGEPSGSFTLNYSTTANFIHTYIHTI